MLSMTYKELWRNKEQQAYSPERSVDVSGKILATPYM